MSATIDEPLERLQQAQRLAAATATPTGACPPAERLWDLAQANLTPAEAGVLIDHVGGCPVCAEALRLAVDLGARPPAEPAVPEAPAEAPLRGGRGWLIGGVTLLAAGVAALFVGRPAPPMPPVPGDDAEGFRGPEGLTFRPTSHSTLPRERFVLTWSAGPAGTTFDIRVLSPELTLLHEGFELTEPHAVVPASALAERPEGAPVLWTVVAHLPDGRSLPLPTWTTRVAPARSEAGDE